MENVDDATATALLVALARVSRLLIDGAGKLQADEVMSGVTYELSIDGPVLDEDISSSELDARREARLHGHQQIVVSGYVDGKPPGHRGAAWKFNIIDLEPNGWQLDRSVTLYTPDDDNVVHWLPHAKFDGWADLAAALPRRIEELLATPLPDAKAN